VSTNKREETTVNDFDAIPELMFWLGDQLPPVPGTSPTAPPCAHDAGQVDDERVMAAAARPLPCLLCGRPEAVRAFFAPKDQRRAGAIVGKVRLLRYSLCKRCVRKPGAQCRVEERLFAAMGSMARRN
jgi:hypothetical protein